MGYATCRYFLATKEVNMQVVTAIPSNHRINISIFSYCSMDNLCNMHGIG
jgi:hypothetical protein